MRAKVMGMVELSNRLGFSMSTVYTILGRAEFAQFIKLKGKSKRAFLVNDDFKKELIEILKKKVSKVYGHPKIQDIYLELIRTKLKCLE